VKIVEVKDIIVGDKLLVDLVGYKGNILINRGTTISTRETTWLKKKLAESTPKLPSIKYRTETRAYGDICDAAGKVLVKRGEKITEEAIAPLLKEGFTLVDLMDAGSRMCHKAQKWTEKSNIAEFNPAVQIERIEVINDDGAPVKTPPAAKTPVKA
jgi:hypothetical protein